MVFGTCLVLCMVGFGIAGTFQASPPQPTISQAIEVPVPLVTPPIIDSPSRVSVRKTSRFASMRANGSRATLYRLLAVEPGTYKLELKVEDTIASFTIEVSADGSTLPRP